MSQDVQATLVQGLRKLGGRATLGDLMGATALPAEDIRAHILPAISGTRGSVSVDEDGELVYALEGGKRPPRLTWLHRAWRVLNNALQFIYFAGLLIFLVAYFLFYVVLLIAIAIAGIALAASAGGGDGCDCDCDCGGCDCDGCDCNGCDCLECGNCCSGCNCGGCGDWACCATTQRRAYGSPERRAERKQHRQERKEVRLARKRKRQERRRARLANLRSSVGLSNEPEVLGLALEREVITQTPSRVRVVHDFIFGAPPQPIDPRQRERNILGYLRDHAGRITAADAVSLTGLPLEQADALVLDMCAQYDGDIEVTEDAAILYTFDSLITTANERPDFLDWLSDQGEVTVADVAAFLEVSASQARTRLQSLESQGLGSFSHSGTTTFLVADQNIAERAESTSEMRDYTYVWERLETSPQIIGVPEGSYGWLIAFNIVNLLLSFAIMAIVTREPNGAVIIFEEPFGPLINGNTDHIILGVMPFIFSALVFVIPLIRTINRFFADRVRLRLNAWRVFLLALFHRLETSPSVTATDILEELGQPPHSNLRKTATRMLEKAVKRLEGSVDPEGYSEAHGHAYTFDRVHTELSSVAHARLGVDLDTLKVKKIVYDSSKPIT